MEGKRKKKKEKKKKIGREFISCPLLSGKLDFATARLAYVTRFGDNAIPDLFARTCDTTPFSARCFSNGVNDFIPLWNNASGIPQFSIVPYLMNPPSFSLSPPPLDDKIYHRGWRNPPFPQNAGKLGAEVGCEMEREIGGSTSSNVLLCRAVLCIVDYYVYGFVSIVISIFVRVFVELRNLNMEYCFFFFLFFFLYI